MPPADPQWTRREVLHAGLAALNVPTLLGAGPEEEGALSFRVVETAGLRRFGYPVHAFRADERTWTNARLTRDSKPVPAQIRPDVRGGARGYAINFNTSPGPLETETYRVEFGPGVAPGPEPRQGMKVERDGDSFRVSNGSVLSFVVPADLSGLLNTVRNGTLDFLGADSPGLTLVDSAGAGKAHRAVVDAMGTAQIARQGPLAVGLRFQGRTSMGGASPVAWTVDLTFPSSKSWVEIAWRVTDPEGRVSSLCLGLSLKVDDGPTLVEFGANSTVYTALKNGERSWLETRPRGQVAEWYVAKGVPDTFATLARATPTSPPAEGWAHVMDRTRCTALAVAGFGRAAMDRIDLDYRGRTWASRGFRGPGEKALTAWFHFVGMPVQVGAVTSPQAMRAPLEIAWEDDR